MSEIFYIIKRNCQIYFREKSTVFYSMMAALIVLLLMVLILGKSNREIVMTVLESYGGTRGMAKDSRNAEYLIQLWSLAGILVVNAVSVSMTEVGMIVIDEKQHRMTVFYVAPVKRWKLVLGEVLSAWLVGTIMCIATLALGEIYFYIKGYELSGVKVCVQLIGVAALNAWTFSAIGYLLACFVHSNGGWSGMMTIVGTLVGFMGGIYLPMGSFSEKIQQVLKCLPVLHGASMMREICTKEAMRMTFRGLPQEVIDTFSERMGIIVRYQDEVMSMRERGSVLVVYGAVAMLIAVLINKNRKLVDRG